MTDERLSRRARRAQEEEALSGELPTTTGSVAEASPDTQSLSRRDRRRLERVAHPVEVWTAEEEMIATGQIPKVTPDVIAEQERLAREKAAQAQAEAEAASAELRRVSLSEASAARVQEVTGATPAVPPSPVTPAPTPPTVAGPPSMQNLFPPGSLQARAFAESQAREAQQAANAAPDPGATQQPGPAADVSDDAAEEIRRLAAAAMATIESAAPVPTPEAVPRIQEEPPASAAPPPASDRYAMPELAAAEPEPQFPRLTPHTFDTPSGGQVSVPTASGQAPQPNPPQAYPPQAPAPSTSGFAPVGSGTGATPVLTPGTGATPVLTPGTGATPVLTPGTGATPTVPENPWSAHPLDSAATPVVDVNAYTPVKDVPQPDFSAVINSPGSGTFSPLGPSTPTGATPLVPAGSPATPGFGTGATPLVPPGAVPTTTGSIPTVRRQPELQPAGGARHFRWAHYLVLFALMFIVGVVVFQVFRLNS